MTSNLMNEIRMGKPLFQLLIKMLINTLNSFSINNLEVWFEHILRTKICKSYLNKKRKKNENKRSKNELNERENYKNIIKSLSQQNLMKMTLIEIISQAINLQLKQNDEYKFRKKHMIDIFKNKKRRRDNLSKNVHMRLKNNKNTHTIITRMMSTTMMDMRIMNTEMNETTTKIITSLESNYTNRNRLQKDKGLRKHFHTDLKLQYENSLKLIIQQNPQKSLQKKRDQCLNKKEKNKNLSK